MKKNTFINLTCLKFQTYSLGQCITYSMFYLLLRIIPESNTYIYMCVY